jgi:hypothetical protein
MPAATHLRQPANRAGVRRFDDASLRGFPDGLPADVRGAAVATRDAPAARTGDPVPRGMPMPDPTPWPLQPEPVTAPAALQPPIRAERNPRRRRRLRGQCHRRRNPLPPRRAQRRRAGRLPLGHPTQTPTSGSGISLARAARPHGKADLKAGRSPQIPHAPNQRMWRYPVWPG